MYEDYVRHVIDETLEMFPDHGVSDADKDRVAKGFSRIEPSLIPEKSPARVQMIQSVVIAKMMMAREESTGDE